MIQTIELNNFLSHSFTKLDFDDDGVTIFIGHNGSGKSSIIDAITFVLFGKHNRKSNRSLIKKGSNQAYVKIRFSVNKKQYEAIRRIDRNGNMYSHLVEIKINGESTLLVSGERKQFGESMTKQIEDIIGVDFSKLKITSIVQQGELNAIIKSKPKEFKEIINALIGIDRLDTAAAAMNLIKKKFRIEIQKKNGYDDTHINILNQKKIDLTNLIKKLEPLQKSLASKKLKYEKYIQVIQTTIENETYKITKFHEVESRKIELTNYAKTLLISIQEKIRNEKQKIEICDNYLKQIADKYKIEAIIIHTNNVLEKLIQKIQQYNIKINIFDEHLHLTKKLKLTDNKCPICYSTIKKLNPLFHEEYINQEITKLKNLIELLNAKKNEYDETNNKNKIKLQMITNAEAVLSTHSITNETDIENIKNECKIYHDQVNMIQRVLELHELDKIASIDSHAQQLYSKIKYLETQIRGFDSKKFSRLKDVYMQKQSQLNNINQELGAARSRLSTAITDTNEIDRLLNELSNVKEYIHILDQIQDKIFNRDGIVATSLRSWVLEMISKKTSEYLALLNTSVNRIMITEKVREMSIICYSKNIALEIDSLSGGEQIGVSVALRLAIMDMLGISNLNCVILDEPTVHLDEERRKSLVDIFSQLSEPTNRVRRSIQLIIITHDSEIFDNSEINKIYKFSKDSHGSKVVAL